jgi:hypothetical protein
MLKGAFAKGALTALNVSKVLIERKMAVSRTNRCFSTLDPIINFCK